MYDSLSRESCKAHAEEVSRKLSCLSQRYRAAESSKMPARKPRRRLCNVFLALRHEQVLESLIFSSIAPATVGDARI